MAKLKWLIISQSSAFFASSLIFPFYILFIKNVGSTYSQFGLAYGLFALTAALVHPIVGRVWKLDYHLILLIHAWGMSVALLLFPYINHVNQVYILQMVLGVFGALQKHGEKILVAEYTDGADRGKTVSNYHFWTSVFSAIAIIGGGVLADYFTIHFIFYSSSLLFFVSGVLMWRMYAVYK